MLRIRPKMCTRAECGAGHDDGGKRQRAIHSNLSDAKTRPLRCIPSMSRSEAIESVVTVHPEELMPWFSPKRELNGCTFLLNPYASSWER